LVLRRGSLSAALGGGIFTFVFDVTTSRDAPTRADIQTLQGTALSISDGTGIDGPPPTVPEPASLTCLASVWLVAFHSFADAVNLSLWMRCDEGRQRFFCVADQKTLAGLRIRNAT
jgi:hypothetical protein